MVALPKSWERRKKNKEKLADILKFPSKFIETGHMSLRFDTTADQQVLMYNK